MLHPLDFDLAVDLCESERKLGGPMVALCGKFAAIFDQQDCDSHLEFGYASTA